MDIASNKNSTGMLSHLSVMIYKDYIFYVIMALIISFIDQIIRHGGVIPPWIDQDLYYLFFDVIYTIFIIFGILLLIKLNVKFNFFH